MLRRRFLKMCGIIPFVGGLSLAGRTGASEVGSVRTGHESMNDISCANFRGELTHSSHFMTTSSFIVGYNSFWFHAIGEKIVYFPEGASGLDQCRTVILGRDTFDFWKLELEKDKFYWCGKKDIYQITIKKGVHFEYHGQA